MGKPQRHGKIVASWENGMENPGVMAMPTSSHMTTSIATVANGL